MFLGGQEDFTQRDRDIAVQIGRPLHHGVIDIFFHRVHKVFRLDERPALDAGGQAGPFQFALKARVCPREPPFQILRGDEDIVISEQNDALLHFVQQIARPVRARVERLLGQSGIGGQGQHRAGALRGVTERVGQDHGAANVVAFLARVNVEVETHLERPVVELSSFAQRINGLG